MPRQISQNDISIEFNLKFNEAKAIPEIRAWIARGMWYGLKKFEKNFETLVMTPLCFGGPGWKSVEQYGAWKWINSPAGMGQLGFTDAGQPLKLLVAMFRSYEVNVTGKPGTGGNFKLSLNMKFFDADKLAAATPHPAAGKDSAPNLDADRSWFDWVFKGRALSEPAKFVKTGPKSGARSSAIAGGEAGLMTEYNDGGLWQVPPRFRLDLEKIVLDNQDKIIRVMEDVVTTEMIRYLNR